MKLVAVPVVIRNHRQFGWQVHTQTRNVVNKTYDPLYHGTEESVGETVKDWENIVNAAVRGLREELGAPDIRIMNIIGANESVISSTRPEDSILEITQPYCFVQQLRGPQPWAGLGFVVVVPDDIEFQLDKESEVSDHTWWMLLELLEELRSNPSAFMRARFRVFLLESVTPKSCRKKKTF